MAGDLPERAEFDRVYEVLQKARALAADHARTMLQLYEQVRQAHQLQLARMRELEERINKSSRPREGAAAARDERTGRAVSAAASPEDEQSQVLRQQHQSMSERLVTLAVIARRIQEVARQSELAASYLDRGISDEDGVSDLGELAKVEMLRAQEDERRRLARDVHDGPAQVLANAIFGLEWCKRLVGKEPDRLITELDNLENDLRAGLAEVRHFIYDLNPISFSDLGLVATLRGYLGRFSERTGIETRLMVAPEVERLTGQIEIGVFRIIQEALQNVRKHSRATRVEVTLARDGPALLVRVADNGIGFDRTRVPGSGTHFGLVSMAERARLLRGELDVDSAPGAGTRVSLRVPFSEFTRDL
ncbi:MAG: hypothetical protein IRY83_07570 [Chloroflexi bacterium]|nr:hypothetical protein [Chloroflexota bacterium]